MPGRYRPALLIALAAYAAVGCHGDVRYVYVDVNRALDTSERSSISVPTAPSREIPPTSTAFKIAAAPEIAEPRSSVAGAAKVRASIAADRDKTYKSIVRRLHDAYAREADNLRTIRLAEFESVRSKSTADAMKSISAAYAKYAEAVGPKIAKLAVTAGFPDPDKAGKRKPSGAEGLDTLAYDTSQTLRAEIAALKADFKRYSDDTLRAAGADVDAKLNQLLADVDRQVGDIDARAQEVASREVSQAQAELGPLLADRPPAPLPAVPESSVVVSSGGLVQPVRTAEPSETGSEDSLDKVKQDLQIWLAVNRFVLREKGRGRDATAEFVAWRNRFRLAPSGRP